MDLEKAIANFDLKKYVKQTFDPVIESGNELRIDCFAPSGCAGSDEKQHLWVNVDKRVWICYKCGYGSSEQKHSAWLPRFIADAEGISLGEAIRRLSSLVQPTPEETLEQLVQDRLSPPRVSVSKKGAISLPQAFRSCPPLRYLLKDRGIAAEILSKYDVRYCREQRLSLWYQRAIFPVRNLGGMVMSAVGRSVIGKEPRWQNWPGSDVQSLLWPLGELVSVKRHWHPFDCRDSHVVLVEGVFDALGVQAAGFTALCTFGKKLSAEQVAVLQRLRPNEITLAWDHNARAKMPAAIDKLRGRFNKINIFAFHDPVWKSSDFGDALIKPELIDIFSSEMASVISTESTEYVAWEAAMRLE